MDFRKGEEVKKLDSKDMYNKRLRLSEEDHAALMELKRATHRPIHIIGHELISLALRVKKIPLKGEVS